MCSIVASKSIEKLKELAELNSYRGTHSHSVFGFSKEHGLVHAFKSFGEVNWDEQPKSAQQIGLNVSVFWVLHQQAPTTEAKDLASVHPASEAGRYLWHNGIIKDNEVKRLQALYGKDVSWDTLLLLRHINETGNVDGIDGTFACLGYAEGLVVFRNEISPLFYSDQGDISSTKFEGSKPVPSNKVFAFDPWSENLFTVKSEFATKENPYFFAPDLEEEDRYTD